MEKTGGDGGDNNNISVAEAAAAADSTVTDDLYNDENDDHDDDDDSSSLDRCFIFSWCYSGRQKQQQIFIALPSPPQHAQVDSTTSAPPVPLLSEQTAESSVLENDSKEKEEVPEEECPRTMEGIDDDDDDDDEDVEKIEEEEDPKFIADCLKKMKLEIERILKATKRASADDGGDEAAAAAAACAVLSPYEMALTLAPNKYYSKACQSSFHLMFLRAANYNPKVAAENCILHFECKADLFGVDKVAKDIMIDEDFNEDDKETLYSGYIQYMPIVSKHSTSVTSGTGERDETTRRNDEDSRNRAWDGGFVEVISPRHAKFKSWKNLVRNL